MSKNLSCPECDSERIKTEVILETDVVIFGGQFEYDEILNTCEECGEKGAFSNQIIDENHKQYYLALKKANQASLEPIVKDLSLRNYSMAYIERALRLPQRTISRWKAKDGSDKGGGSASGMALMRIIRTYPWILNVADENFEEQFALGELVHQAGEVFKKHCPPSNVDISGSTERLAVTFTWNNDKGNQPAQPVMQTTDETIRQLPQPITI